MAAAGGTLYTLYRRGDPSTGELLWSHPHEAEYGLNVSQPVWDAGDHVLFVSSAYGGGARGLELVREGDRTAVRELWATAASS